MLNKHSMFTTWHSAAYNGKLWKKMHFWSHWKLGSIQMLYGDLNMQCWWSCPTPEWRPYENLKWVLQSAMHCRPHQQCIRDNRIGNQNHKIKKIKSKIKKATESKCYVIVTIWWLPFSWTGAFASVVVLGLGGQSGSTNSSCAKCMYLALGIFFLQKHIKDKNRPAQRSLAS